MIGIFPFCRNESTKQEMELQAKLLEFHTKNGLDVDLRKIAYIAEKLLPENIGYALSGNLLFFSEDFIKSEKSTNNWWLALESNLLSMPSIISKILRPEEMAVLLIKGYEIAKVFEAARGICKVLDIIKANGIFAFTCNNKLYYYYDLDHFSLPAKIEGE